MSTQEFKYGLKKELELLNSEDKKIHAKDLEDLINKAKTQRELKKIEETIFILLEKDFEIEVA